MLSAVSDREQVENHSSKCKRRNVRILRQGVDQAMSQYLFLSVADE